MLALQSYSPVTSLVAALLMVAAPLLSIQAKPRHRLFLIGYDELFAQGVAEPISTFLPNCE